MAPVAAQSWGWRGSLVCLLFVLLALLNILKTISMCLPNRVTPSIGILLLVISVSFFFILCTKKKKKKKKKKMSPYLSLTASDLRCRPQSHTGGTYIQRAERWKKKCVYPRLAPATTFSPPSCSHSPHFQAQSSPIQSIGTIPSVRIHSRRQLHVVSGWNHPHLLLASHAAQTRSPIKPCSFSWSSSSLHCYFPSCRKRYNFLITDWGAIPRYVKLETLWGDPAWQVSLSLSLSLSLLSPSWGP